MSRKIAFIYDESMSGQSIYAYVGGNPISNVDPSGLAGAAPLGGFQPPAPMPCPCPTVPRGPSQASCNANISQAQQQSGNLNWFYNQVRNKAPWDYKQQSSQYQNFGNFNYGATGAALGIPPSVLLRGAGWAQQQAGTSLPQWGNWYSFDPYGDDPNDQKMIQQGIQYYLCGCYK